MARLAVVVIMTKGRVAFGLVALSVGYRAEVSPEPGLPDVLTAAALDYVPDDREALGAVARFRAHFDIHRADAGLILRRWCVDWAARHADQGNAGWQGRKDCGHD